VHSDIHVLYRRVKPPLSRFGIGELEKGEQAVGIGLGVRARLLVGHEALGGI
jgi:hypothetical protein